MFNLFDSVGIFLIFLVGILIIWIWRKQSARYYLIQQQLEKKISLIEKNYILLSENANDIILLLDEKGVILWVNARAVQSYGYTKIELIGKHLSDLGSVDSREDVFALLEDIARAGGKVYESVHQRNDGYSFPVEVSARLIEISRVKFFQSIIRDITERKRAEKALQESEKQYRELFDNANDIIYTLDLSGRFIEFNKMAETTTGYSVRDAPQLTVTQLVAPEYQQQIREMLNRKFSEADPSIYEIEILTKYGKRVALEINNRLIFHDGRPVGIQGIARDITERKRAQEALNLQKAYFQQLFENSPEGIVMLDNSDRVVTSNISFGKLFQYSVDEIKGRPVNDIIVPENLKEEASTLSRNVLQKEIVQKDTIRKRKDGSLVNVSILGFPITFGENQIGVYGIYSDIAERKRAEAALRESEERFRSLAENIPGVIYLCKNDSRYTMLYLNDTIETLTGYSKSDFLNDQVSFVELYHPDDHQWIPDEVNRALEHRRPFHLIYRIKHRSGNWRWVEEIGIGVFQNEELLFLEGFLSDITERKHTEEQIRSSLKEKEVLLKEIHHRVKNNLQVISSLLKLQAGSAKKKRALDILNESQNRIKSMALIHEKLYQSRELSSIDFPEYIRNLVTSLFRSYGENSKNINFTIKGEKVLLSIDTALPCGLIINELISNSLKYAFPKGRKGEIGIELNSDKNNNYVLVVADNGIGFSKNLDFRHTESLGLQLVVSLTEQLNGTIQLDREEGVKFKIIFSELKYQERG